MRFIRVSGKNALIHSLHGLRVDLQICEAEMVLQTNFEKAVCNEFLNKPLHETGISQENHQPVSGEGNLRGQLLNFYDNL